VCLPNLLLCRSQWDSAGDSLPPDKARFLHFVRVATCFVCDCWSSPQHFSRFPKRRHWKSFPCMKAPLFTILPLRCPTITRKLPFPVSNLEILGSWLETLFSAFSTPFQLLRWLGGVDFLALTLLKLCTQKFFFISLPAFWVEAERWSLVHI